MCHQCSPSDLSAANYFSPPPFSPPDYGRPQQWVGLVRQVPAAWSLPETRSPGPGQTGWERRRGSSSGHIGQTAHTGKHFAGILPLQVKAPFLVQSFQTPCSSSPMVVHQSLISPRRTPVGTWLKLTKLWNSTGTVLTVRLKPWHRCIYTIPTLPTEQKTLHLHLYRWYTQFTIFSFSILCDLCMLSSLVLLFSNDVCVHACMLQLGGNLMEVINHFQTQMLGQSTGASPSSLHSSDLDSGV